jgi:AbrB family looped-hinge helix DNA binding protein
VVVGLRGGGSLEQGFYGAVTVGERGQIVIPAEARRDFEISPGQKLLMFNFPHVSGLILMKVEHFAQMQARIKDMETALGRMVGAEPERGGRK